MILETVPLRLGKTVNERGYGTGLPHLVFLRDLIEAGKIRSVMDRRYPLEETEGAHRYVDTGQKAGNVVIMIGRS